MTVVQIEKPEGAKLADWFAELRLWFDNNDCSPILFAQAGRVMNKDRFNIKFANDVQAHLFASNFAKYCPSISRPAGEEPMQVKAGVDPAAGAAIGKGP